jgi:hypothetical protein
MQSMTIVLCAIGNHPMSSRSDLYRLTVKQFDRMVEAGLFGMDRAELIEGFMVVHRPRSPRPVQVGTIGLRTRARGMATIRDKMGPWGPGPNDAAS